MPDFAQKEIPVRTQFYVHRKDGQFVRAPNVDNSYKWAGGLSIEPRRNGDFRYGSPASCFLKSNSLQALFASQRTKEGSRLVMELAG